MNRRSHHDVEIIRRRPFRTPAAMETEGAPLAQVSPEDEQALRDRGFEVERAERIR